MSTPAPHSAPARQRAVALTADDRRDTIVQATLGLLLEHGERVTTRQIAEAAGIAEGTIFRVFADKDEVIRACVEAAMDDAAFEEAVDAIGGEASFAGRLEGAVALLQERVVGMWRLLSSVGPRFHTDVKGRFHESAALTRLFAGDRKRITVEPAVAASLLRSITLAMTHPVLVPEPSSPSEIVSLLLNGIAVRRVPC